MTGEGLRDNPFHVLEVPVSASRIEIERAGAKLLAMLGVGMEAARTYPSPLGRLPRDEALVRRSLDRLRDPVRRAADEHFGRVAAVDGPEVLSDPSLTAWPDAAIAFGLAPW